MPTPEGLNAQAPIVKAVRRRGPLSAIGFRYEIAEDFAFAVDCATMRDALDEIITLVDADDVETGGASKARVHAEGLLHRAFSIFLLSKSCWNTGVSRIPRRIHSPTPTRMIESAKGIRQPQV